MPNKLVFKMSKMSLTEETERNLIDFGETTEIRFRQGKDANIEQPLTCLRRGYYGAEFSRSVQ